ncbi:MAG: hypothetical protein KAY32_17665 [Candidatus Eisenbacteria sp.]|nr:hypothetical protein [Candidatus Eisenbacteria bacterium]
MKAARGAQSCRKRLAGKRYGCWVFAFVLLVAAMITTTANGQVCLYLDFDEDESPWTLRTETDEEDA